MPSQLWSSLLGVQRDLSGTPKGYFEICNTPKCTEDVLTLIDTIFSSRVLNKKDAQALKGRLAFAYAQIFGLPGKMALQRISEHAFKQPFTLDIPQKLMNAVQFLKDRLEKGVPRKIFKGVSSTFIILSDASFEADRSGGLGGVLVSANKSLISWFGIKLCPDMVA